jgi:uncharacterized protein (UPF0262 family)
MDEKNFRIADVELDEAVLIRLSPDIEHERRIAIFDLLEENYFEPIGAARGPFNLRLVIEENRLVFDVRMDDKSALGKIILALGPFRRIIKDYFMICESYYEAIKSAPPSQIEAIDMGRRGLHNEGSDLLRERLAGKIALDHDTARRLFTLVCVLHLRA